MTWDHGASNSYRMGAEGKYDLKLAPGYDPDAPQVTTPSSATTTTAAPVTTITTSVKSTKVGQPSALIDFV